MDFWQNLQPLFLLKCFGYVILWKYFWWFWVFPSFLVEYYLYTSTINLFVDILKCTILCSYIWNMGPSFLGKLFHICMSDILFCQIPTHSWKFMWPLFLGFRLFCVIDFSKFYQSKCWKPKKQRQDELLWMLWFDEKSICNVHLKLMNITRKYISCLFILFCLHIFLAARQETL